MDSLDTLEHPVCVLGGVQYWKVEITGYFNTTYQLEIRDAVGTTVGKSFDGTRVVSIWALMRSPDSTDERIAAAIAI